MAAAKSEETINRPAISVAEYEELKTKVDNYDAVVQELSTTKKALTRVCCCHLTLVLYLCAVHTMCGAQYFCSL